MRKLRTNFERFCMRNQDKGIPNLMLYIVLGNAVVAIMSLINGGSFLYSALCFDKARILKGEVWRLVTYVFTQSGGDLMQLLFLYFFYMLGKHVEDSMGTFKFTLFYVSGVVLMDVFAMIFCPVFTGTVTTQEELAYWFNTVGTYENMAYYLHLSLVLTFATTHPNSQFMILFIIPIKAWVLALFYLALTLIDVINMSVPVMYFPHNLFPLVALGNYFLFTGDEIKNLFPGATFPRKKPAPKTGTIPFRQPQTQKKAYNHRCEICGKTDVSNPELEFRYCSRCHGYHCYCLEHINDHNHITEDSSGS
ncbi:MAG: rhomboid family intramembrane serine protease [Oscillospiraceae bacterium]|nr:rhomboid family intramembrane serine protease [Oscillospiraceae bacterium]